MVWCWPGDKPLSEPMMVRLLIHICVARPQWVNSYIFLFFLLCDLSDLILWAVELNTSLCVNFTHPHWLFFTSHHVAILFALCSHMVTHIFQSLHVCAFCVNNPFPKFVTRGILWVIGWDNQYCNQHLPPEQYSLDCKYIEDSHKSPWMTGIAPVPFVRERF